MSSDYVMGESVREGSLLFVRKADGMLHSSPGPELAYLAPVAIASRDIEKGRTVRILPTGSARLLIYNPCGDRHLGRCCVNGLRPDGTRGYTCTHCGDAITGEQRDEIAESFAEVAKLRKAAGAS
jgi:hypothetical protein